MSIIIEEWRTRLSPCKLNNVAEQQSDDDDLRHFINDLAPQLR
jgi:hypothetical protein